MGKEAAASAFAFSVVFVGSVFLSGRWTPTPYGEQPSKRNPHTGGLRCDLCHSENFIDIVMSHSCVCARVSK